MYCSKCGFLLDDEDIFCRQCGVKIKKAENEQDERDDAVSEEEKKPVLLDIKPYVPQLYEDTIDELKIGWFETKHEKAKSQKSDARFK